MLKLCCVRAFYVAQRGIGLHYAAGYKGIKLGNVSLIPRAMEFQAHLPPVNTFRVLIDRDTFDRTAVFQNFL